jgi:hypothetical protein
LENFTGVSRHNDFGRHFPFLFSKSYVEIRLITWWSFFSEFCTEFFRRDFEQRTRLFLLHSNKYEYTYIHESLTNGSLSADNMPSARLTLHSMKLCTKLKICRKKPFFLVLRSPLRHF